MESNFYGNSIYSISAIQFHCAPFTFMKFMKCNKKEFTIIVNLCIDIRQRHLTAFLGGLAYLPFWINAYYADFGNAIFYLFIITVHSFFHYFVQKKYLFK